MEAENPSRSLIANFELRRPVRHSVALLLGDTRPTSRKMISLTLCEFPDLRLETLARVDEAP